MLGGGLRSAQPLAVFSVAEHVELVHWRIAGLVRNAFRVHCSEKALRRNTGKLFAVDVKDVCILTVAGAAFVKLLRGNAGYLTEFAIQQARILVTSEGLLIEPSELRHQDDALPFAESIIRSIAEVTIKPFSRQAAAIMDGTRLALEAIIIRDDHAAFTCRHQLAGLKTEGSADTGGSDTLSPPFAGVCVCAILDQQDSVAGCEVFQRIEIGRMPAHVDRNDRLRTRSDGILGQVGIETISVRTNVH